MAGYKCSGAADALADPKTSVTFKINGIQHTVPNTHSARMSLNEYIRDVAGLTGTKVMCREGGCGCCIVMATFKDAGTKANQSVAINSCLRPVYSIDGWEITTTEGLGNRHSGLHTVQKRLAENNGSQCGMCTPGMVMSMYSLLQNDAKPSEETVEKSLGGNICRCTGYRPILDAFKSFSPDADPSKVPGGCIDIEELGKHGCCGLCDESECQKSEVCDHLKPQPVALAATDGDWYRPTTLTELFNLLKQLTGSSVRLISGNTAIGIYKEDTYADAYVDVNAIPDLHTTTVSATLVQVGGGVSLTTCMENMEKASSLTGYAYCAKVADHFTRIGSVPIRNAGSLAGNLMMKHAHNDFSSDLFIILEAIGAKINISSAASSSSVSPSEFLKVSMSQKVIKSVTFPKLGSNVRFGSYKPMPRAENAHALVNAAFRMEVDASYRVVSIPALVFGGINETFIHASGTEGYLFNKQLTGPSVLQGAIMALEGEVVPTENPPLASASYRKSLATSLFYKFILEVCAPEVSDRLKSGATVLTRPVSTGKQDYSTYPTKWPLTQAFPKVASEVQATGEAKYMDDLPILPGELQAALVVTTQGNATLGTIDASEALKMPGVVTFLTAKDVPTGGVNNFAPPGAAAEEVLCSDKVMYAGQPLGIIVADNRITALEAARKVKVTYTDIKAPILDIEAAIKANSFFPSRPGHKKGDAAAAIAASDKVVTGKISMDTQYHFTMETQGCRVVPTEDGFDVSSTTQWIYRVQEAVANFLNVKISDVRCEVKRLGGGYGCKITRNAMIAAQCALAASKVNRPVRLMLDLQTNMEAIGKRCPYMAEYKVGVSNAGMLNGVEVTYYLDCGCSPNDNSIMTAMQWSDNAYFCANWDITNKLIKTNIPSTTWTRAPGSVPAVFIMEQMMEHVAKELNMDPLAFKQLNLYKKGQANHLNQPLPYANIRELVTSISTLADIAARQTAINTFNKANRWKKRGMATVPLKYGVEWEGVRYSVLVAIYNGDGSLSITHAGIEVGQGINTKVMQVAAHLLDIDIDLISIRPSADHPNANSSTTGGSITSELCCMGVKNCCETLIKRMAPVKEKMGDDVKWPDLVKKCFAEGIDLSARNWVSPESEYTFQYMSYGVTCMEVELDVLTGESMVRRADILFDCGESMNPDIDIGQVEGAFIMGLGYWRTEEIKYDKTTGVNLTNSTWNYKPPVYSDIPVDFRVTLLKDAPNPLGVLRSKTSGEPPQCMACVALFSQKAAIAAARAEVNKTDYFRLNGPVSVEVSQTMCLPDSKNYVLKEA